MSAIPHSTMNHRFTPTQRRILDLLSDGLPHLRADVKECLSDELAVGTGAMIVHICHIRKVIKPQGLDIVTQLMGKTLYYRLIRIYMSDGTD